MSVSQNKSMTGHKPDQVWQYGVAVPQEDADAAMLAGPGGPGLAHVGQLLPRP